jgi:hypothetical protein
MKSNGKGKTFFYRFNLETDLNFEKKLYNLTADGAGHGDDLVSTSQDCYLSSMIMY